MFGDLVFPSNVSSMVTSVLLQILLVHEFLRFAYFICEKGLLSVVLSNQFLEGGSEVEKYQALHGL